MVFLEQDWIIFPETVGNVIIPSDEVIFFGVETTNQIKYMGFNQHIAEYRTNLHMGMLGSSKDGADGALESWFVDKPRLIWASATIQATMI